MQTKKNNILIADILQKGKNPEFRPFKSESKIRFTVVGARIARRYVSERLGS